MAESAAGVATSDNMEYESSLNHEGIGLLANGIGEKRHYGRDDDFNYILLNCSKSDNFKQFVLQLRGGLLKAML